MGNTQLFCFPFAGGNSYFYESFREYLSCEIELIPIELSGHGYRIMEQCNDTMDKVVEDAYSEVSKHLKKDVPFVFFGYSMGTMICYELSLRLYDRLNIHPQHIFFAANTPPHICEDEPDCYNWDDQRFIEKIKEYGGVSEEVLQEKEILDVFLPVMRSDLKVCNEYVCLDRSKLLQCDITVLYSKVDDPNDVMNEWKTYTNKNCKLYQFKGDHFFINKNMHEVTMLINKVVIGG